MSGLAMTLHPTVKWHKFRSSDTNLALYQSQVHQIMTAMLM